MVGVLGTGLTSNQSALSDAFGRHISYLRLSVTDRCDLRCRYCMAENMQFLARKDLLTVDEMTAISELLISLGIRKIRLTGGEPLTRRDLPELAKRLGRLVGAGGLEELTLTTNGVQLSSHAATLAEAGVRRINVSLDTRDADRFHHITRWGTLDRVMEGIAAAKAAGIRIKINMVALKDFNEDEFTSMLQWCGDEGHDLTLIETMPLGVVDEDRTDRYMSLDRVRTAIEERFTLVPSVHRTGGPARYFDVPETGGRLGLITPMSQNFCEGCNRIRLSAEGRLYMCLGHEDQVDLKTAYRTGGPAALAAALRAGLAAKPLRHQFRIDANTPPAVSRHMSVTGG
jgi:GTP 3',8-cyclase